MSKNPTPLSLERPLDLDDAREASRKLAEQRRTAEDWHEQLVEEASAAERGYRQAYAKAIVVADGPVPVREAKAKAETAQLAYERDLKERLVRVATEKLRGLEGERSMLKSLIDWSARLDPFTMAEQQRQSDQARRAVA